MIRRLILIVMIASGSIAAPITFDYSQINQGFALGFANSNSPARLDSVDGWSGGLQDGWTLGRVCEALVDFDSSVDQSLDTLEAKSTVPVLKIAFPSAQIIAVSYGSSTLDLSPWVGTNVSVVIIRSSIQKSSSFILNGSHPHWDDFKIRFWTPGTVTQSDGVGVAPFNNLPQAAVVSGVDYTERIITSYIGITDAQGHLEVQNTDPGVYGLYLYNSYYYLEAYLINQATLL